MSNFKVQTVVLKTEDGSAEDEKQLQKIWQDRLEEIAPYYRIEGVSIKEKSVLDILLKYTEEKDGEILVTNFGELEDELEEKIK